MKQMLAILAAGLLAAAAASGAAQEPPPAPPAKDDPLRRQCAELLRSKMRQFRVPAAVLTVVRDFDVDWTESHGTLGVRYTKGCRPDTVFQAGTLSMLATATCVLALVHQGKLALDADVSSLLKQWRFPDSELAATEKATLRRLLRHEGGVNVPVYQGYGGEVDVPLLDILNGTGAASSGAVKLVAVPGREFRFSSGGFSVIEQALTDVCGAPFADVMRATVFQPLGMRDCHYGRLPDGIESLAAIGHTRTPGAPKSQSHSYAEFAAAGLRCSAVDLARLVAGLMQAWAGRSDRLMSPALAREMTQGGLHPAIGLGVDMAGSDDTFHFWAAGVASGFYGYVAGFPARGDGVAVMTNSEDGGQLIESLLPGLAKARGWPATPKAVRTRQ